jgi:GT2 family glycosyltransferase
MIERVAGDTKDPSAQMVGAHPQISRVCAIVTTHNRKELLRRCLTALTEQERPVAKILVVDNASTDGTSEMVTTEFPGAELLALEENIGGAGGFHRGLSWAHERGYDWFWVMDDDTFVLPDTLEKLLAGADRSPGDELPLMVASKVCWKDDRLHPMNRPLPRWRWRAELNEAIAEGLLLIRNATFVSVALRREAIDRFGLPLPHYFLWTDDVEFTSRILKDNSGYLVPESRVYHWTAEPHTAVTSTGGRFYYHVRNSLLLLRGTSLTIFERENYLRYWMGTIGEYLRVNRSWSAAKVVLRGVADGMRLPVR